LRARRSTSSRQRPEKVEKPEVEAGAQDHGVVQVRGSAATGCQITRVFPERASRAVLRAVKAPAACQREPG
jgi:hypothetical protein